MERQNSTTSEANRPPISVVIPVHNGAATLHACFESLRKSTYNDFEVIIADDGSTDNSVNIAKEHDCRVVSTGGRQGASVARNIGVKEARHDIIFFTDSDVAVLPDTLQRIAEDFRRHPEIDAVIGSYTSHTPSRSFFSIYKNYMHHYTHQNSRDDAITFWTGCGALRKDTFSKIGGFSTEYRRAMIEDIELGYRMCLAGHKILLDKKVQVSHLKDYSLGDLIKSDIFNRAIPWTRLMLQRKIVRSDLNTTPGAAVSLMACYLCIPAAVACIFTPWALMALGLLLGIFLFFNRDFLGFIFRNGGSGIGLLCIPMHFFFYLYSGLGLILGVLSFLKARFAGGST
jgi:glycosyltransferase involved in cell wall biosynthesis